MASSSPSATAHAQSVKSFPTNNQIVKVAPTSAWIMFNENILTLKGKAKNYLQVVDSKKQRVDLGDYRISRSKISVNLGKNLKPGKFQLMYRVVSADGHPLTGSIPFIYRP
jgi:copper transport protein